MLILTLRTDKPEAEIGLYQDDKKLAYDVWQAHRTLSETIHLKINELLKQQSKDWSDIQAIICYEGPGSFTGLRIGLSVANSLAYSLGVPVVGESGENWIDNGIKDLKNNVKPQVVLPQYGSPAHITQPKK